MSTRGGFVPLSPRTTARNEAQLPLLDSLQHGPSSKPSHPSQRQTSGVGPSLISPIPRYPQPQPVHFPPTTFTPSPPTTSLPHFLTLLPFSSSTLERIHANTGLLLVASSQIFFVAMGLSAKYFISSTSVSTLTLIFVRMGITALLCLTWLTLTHHPNPALGPPDPHIRRLLMLRGFFGFGGLFANYQTLRGLSLSDSVTIQFLAPNLTAALGWAVLGETLGWREVTAGLTCMGGVILVSRPPFLFGAAAAGGVSGGHSDESGAGTGGGGGLGGGPSGVGAEISAAERMLAVGWAFVSLIFATCAYITIRKIGKTAHPMHSMLYFCYSCLITTSIGLVVNYKSFVFLKNWKEFWLIMLIGTFGFIAQILLTIGLQREKAGRASLAMYLSLFYSLVFELLFFGTIPPFLSLLGAFIIISSAIWVAISKKTEDPDPSSERPSTANGYTRVNADEETLPFSRTPSPLPLNGRLVRGGSYDYSNGARGVGGGDKNGGGETLRKESESLSQGGNVNGALGVGAKLLRRKSSASSSGKGGFGQ